jgi:uncharacterized membrane protein
MLMRETAASSRIPALDLVRGIALAAMVIYHTGWDIAYLGLGAANLRDNVPWQVFGHGIAASFLTLTGISLVLAHQGGLRPAAFLRRLGRVAGAAALVSGVTYLAFPESFIYFGILHAIALGSVLALPFLRAPLVVVVLAAGLFVALPLLVSSAGFSSPAFSSSWLVWLGLGNDAPPAQDFVPVFPWFGYVLLGVLLARRLDLTRAIGSVPQHPVTGGLMLAGRHSLAFYLLHQPILFGALWLYAQAMVPGVDKPTQDFLAACTRECTSNGAEPKICTRICHCAAETLKTEKLWSEAMSDRMTPDLQARFAAISRACAQQVKAP